MIVRVFSAMQQQQTRVLWFHHQPTHQEQEILTKESRAHIVGVVKDSFVELDIFVPVQLGRSA
jgi:hypothetical protein